MATILYMVTIRLHERQFKINNMTSMVYTSAVNNVSLQWGIIVLGALEGHLNRQYHKKRVIGFLNRLVLNFYKLILKRCLCRKRTFELTQTMDCLLQCKES